MGDANKLPTSDDEEDLEALRLAALQSLKKKNAAVNGMNQQRHTLHLDSDKRNRYNRSMKSMQGRRGGRFFGPHPGRTGKSAQFNNRVRNTNLISIPTISSEEEKVEERKSDDGGGATLTLPQDRYCGKEKKEEKSDEGTSKFTRYDKSDESESESEEEEAASSEDDSPGKLKRANSLEALMEELDAEIQGKTIVKEEKPAKEEKPKKKVKKKKRTSPEVVSTSDSDAKIAEQKEEKQECDKNIEVEDVKEERIKLGDSPSPPRKRLRSRSPVNRRSFNRRRRGNFPKFPRQPVPNVAFAPQFPAPMVPFPPQPFNPLFYPPGMGMMSQPPPPFFDRPLSPLRSIPSRSPPPPWRPFRPEEPLAQPQEVPHAQEVAPEVDHAQKKEIPFAEEENVGKSADSSPKNKPSVRERLGLKPSKTEPESKEKPKEPSPKKDEKPLDPVLEARKRKFESNEIKMKEGIIRLKPKEDNKPKEDPPSPPPPTPVAEPVSDTPPQKPARPKELDEFEELEKLLNEDALLEGEGDDIVLDPKVDDIFSDEDSTSDNEGRFKVKQQSDKKPPVLSFAKLVNGERREIKPEPLPDSPAKRRERRPGRPSERRRSRPRPPPTRRRRGPRRRRRRGQEKSPAKGRAPPKNERHVTTPMEKRFERKIEIKIKNPSKYERGGKLKFAKDAKEEKAPEKVKRKVEVEKEGDEEEAEPEIVVENDSGEEDDSAVSEGDLRAQLSKKRAEKLHRVPIEGVSSRLLQSALQGAVFKETKKKAKDQDISNSDGKLPVYLRLGIADAYKETKVKRKSRKRKNREVLEQVYYLLLRHYYTSQFRSM
ncbi:hypothetical protein NQ318_009127 [Aromia moschata]|uniref:Uncharacterized protein n=1 Tax=Aromia moschata TaxID=1265417 RepID=A0AAV8XIW0_9CUCU|nr:hypothetical protein NQ318_009127 [Aromia moschata]